MSEPSRQLCSFVVGDLLLGVDVTQVQEVLRPQPMTKVPRAEKSVRGLIHLRGQIVTALDVRSRLGMPARDGESMNVLVRVAGGIISLLVDEVGDVLDVPERCFEKTPESLRPGLRELVRGVFTLNPSLLLLINVERLAAVGS